MSNGCFTGSIIDSQLIERIFHSQVILNRFLYFCLSLIFVISVRLNLSIPVKYLDCVLARCRNAHLPYVGGWAIWKKVESNRDIRLLVYEWKSRENLAGGIDFWTTLYKSQSSVVFFWLLGQYLGVGWGIGLLRQLLHAVLLGTSWKLHCMDLLCQSVCFFKQFDILSRQQPGKFTFQMQFLWVPISMWPISAPCSNCGPNQSTLLTTVAVFAVQLPIRLSSGECQI